MTFYVGAWFTMLVVASLPVVAVVGLHLIHKLLSSQVGYE